MYKIIITIIMLTIGALSIQAQLRVKSDGNVLVGDSTVALTSALTVNGMGIAPSATANSSKKALLAYTSGDCKNNTAVTGKALNTPIFNPFPSNPLLPTYISTVNCGVHGLAGGNDVNIGILGSLSSSATSGAGIYGTSSMDANITLLGKYAGYFDGDVRSTGMMSANLTNSYDISNSVNSEYGEMPSVISDLMDVDVLQYTPSGYDPYPSSMGNADSPDAIIIEIPRNHALLDISSVNAVFPYLVHANDNGGNYINYTELIPLLLKAIQELKAQVDALSGQSGDGDLLMAPMHTATSDVNSLAGQTAKLHQNSPNPFTERTEIRFSVPEDARSAYLYIFDMSGKMLRQIPVDASMQSVAINGYELPAGIYIYSLAVNGQEIDTKRMILSK